MRTRRHCRPPGVEVLIPRTALGNKRNRASGIPRIVVPALKDVMLPGGDGQSKIAAGPVIAGVNHRVIAVIGDNIGAAQVLRAQGIGFFAPQIPPDLGQFRHHPVEIGALIQPQAEIVVPRGIGAFKANRVPGQNRRGIGNLDPVLPDFRRGYAVAGGQVDGYAKNPLSLRQGRHLKGKVIRPFKGDGLVCDGPL